MCDAICMENPDGWGNRSQAILACINVRVLMGMIVAGMLVGWNFWTFWGRGSCCRDECIFVLWALFKFQSY
jgi:uncharacterized membrane protein